MWLKSSLNTSALILRLLIIWFSCTECQRCIASAAESVLQTGKYTPSASTSLLADHLILLSPIVWQPEGLLLCLSEASTKKNDWHFEICGNTVWLFCVCVGFFFVCLFFNRFVQLVYSFQCEISLFIMFLCLVLIILSISLVFCGWYLDRSCNTNTTLCKGSWLTLRESSKTQSLPTLVVLTHLTKFDKDWWWF